MKRDYEQRIDNMTAQVVCAEETLNHRDSQIKALKSHIDKLNDEKEALNYQVS